MTHFIPRMRGCFVFASIICLVLVCSFRLFADESAVKMVKLDGAVDRTGPSEVFPFALSGVASHLGKFTGVGEVTFVPGPQPDTELGSGVVVFSAANGEKLVGVVSWELSASESDTHETSIRFAWRDYVTFVDGSVVSNTGRFVTNRPPGLVVIAQTVCVRIPFTNKYICTLVYR